MKKSELHKHQAEALHKLVVDKLKQYDQDAHRRIKVIPWDRPDDKLNREVLTDKALDVFIRAIENPNAHIKTLNLIRDNVLPDSYTHIRVVHKIRERNESKNELDESDNSIKKQHADVLHNIAVDALSKYKQLRELPPDERRQYADEYTNKIDLIRKVIANKNTRDETLEYIQHTIPSSILALIASGTMSKRSRRMNESARMKLKDFVQDVTTHAAKVEPSITQTVVDVKPEDADLKGLDFRLKSKKSVADKIIRDANNDDKSLEQAADDMRDLNRYTIVPHDDKDYTKVVKDTLSNLEDKGNKVTTFKNSWGKPAVGEDPTFQGVNAFVKDKKTGQEYELQFHTNKSYEARVKSHKDYETIRSEDGDDVNQEAAEARQADAQRTVKPPKGAKSLSYPVNESEEMKALHQKATHHVATKMIEKLKHYNDMDSKEFAQEETLNKYDKIVNALVDIAKNANTSDETLEHIIKNTHPMSIIRDAARVSKRNRQRRAMKEDEENPMKAAHAEALHKLLTTDRKGLMHPWSNERTLDAIKNPNVRTDTLHKVAQIIMPHYEKEYAKYKESKQHMKMSRAFPGLTHLRKLMLGIIRHDNTSPETLQFLAKAKGDPGTSAAGKYKYKFIWKPKFEAEVAARRAKEEARLAKKKKVNESLESEHKKALVKLADSDEIGVLRNLSDNPKTPPHILHKLSEHPDFFIRWNVASNHSTPTNILDKLSSDHEVLIRRAVSRHPNTSYNTLSKLIKDPDSVVRINAKKKVPT